MALDVRKTDAVHENDKKFPTKKSRRNTTGVHAGAILVVMIRPESPARKSRSLTGRAERPDISPSEAALSGRFFFRHL
jgi:hypothetical protein